MAWPLLLSVDWAGLWRIWGVGGSGGIWGGWGEEGDWDRSFEWGDSSCSWISSIRDRWLLVSFFLSAPLWTKPGEWETLTIWFYWFYSTSTKSTMFLQSLLCLIQAPNHQCPSETAGCWSRSSCLLHCGQNQDCERPDLLADFTVLLMKGFPCGTRTRTRNARPKCNTVVLLEAGARWFLLCLLTLLVYNAPVRTFNTHNILTFHALNSRVIDCFDDISRSGLPKPCDTHP